MKQPKRRPRPNLEGHALRCLELLKQSACRAENDGWNAWLAREAQTGVDCFRRMHLALKELLHREQDMQRHNPKDPFWAEELGSMNKTTPLTRLRIARAKRVIPGNWLLDV